MARRSALLLAALLAVPALAACGSEGSAAPELGARGEIAPAGQRVPAAVRGPLASGGDFDLAALRGKVVVINAFGSWCTPCKQEAPALNQAYAATRARGDVEFVGLAIRDTVPKLREFAAQYAVAYPLVQDEDGGILARIPALAVVPGPPSTLVLDRQGRVAARFIGKVLGSQLEGTVAAVAAEPA